MVFYESVLDGLFCFSTTQCKIRGQTQMGKCCSPAKKKEKKEIDSSRHFLLFCNYLCKRSALLTESLAMKQEGKKSLASV